MRYHRPPASGTEMLMWLVVLIFLVVIAVVLGNRREQAARDCIANGGQWVTVARDYHTCIGGNSGK